MADPGGFLRYRLAIDDAITYGEPAQAEALAVEALALARKQELVSEVFYFSAQIRIARERFEEALPLLDQAIALNPQDGAAFNDRALCMIELGRLDGALEYFDRGIAVEPDFATIHHNKGWFLNQLGQSRQALDCFREALRFDSQRAVTYENIADCYLRLGSPAEALTAYQSAISLLANRCEAIRVELEEKVRQLQGGSGN